MKLLKNAVNLTSYMERELQDYMPKAVWTEFKSSGLGVHALFPETPLLYFLLKQRFHRNEVSGQNMCQTVAIYSLL